jgi:hypothetical protein
MTENSQALDFRPIRLDIRVIFRNERHVADIGRLDEGHAMVVEAEVQARYP